MRRALSILLPGFRSLFRPTSVGSVNEPTALSKLDCFNRFNVQRGDSFRDLFTDDDALEYH